MKVWSFARYGFGLAAAAALMAGCSAAGTSPSLGSSTLNPAGLHGVPHDLATVNKLFAMTNPRHQVPQQQHVYNGKSWMAKVNNTDPLVYASDIEYGTVDVVDHTTGALVGQASGFEYPYGSCSDSHGNVYVADFDLGTVTELAAGGTTAIGSWSSGGGYPIGCSISAKGDLAITNFEGTSGNGSVEIYPGAGPTGTNVSGPGYMWPAGYDKKGNLNVEASDASPCSTPCVAQLKKGGNSFNVLSFNETIGFPGPTQLAGKKIFFSDQDGAGLSYQIAFYPSKVKGNKAKSGKPIVLAGDCYASGEPYIGFSGSWGNVSSNMNGLQDKKVTGYVSGNDDCLPSPIDTWGATGGNPTSSIAGGSFGLPYDYYYASTITN